MARAVPGGVRRSRRDGRVLNATNAPSLWDVQPRSAGAASSSRNRTRSRPPVTIQGQGNRRGASRCPARRGAKGRAAPSPRERRSHRASPHRRLEPAGEHGPDPRGRRRRYDAPETQRPGRDCRNRKAPPDPARRRGPVSRRRPTGSRRSGGLRWPWLRSPRPGDPPR